RDSRALRPCGDHGARAGTGARPAREDAHRLPGAHVVRASHAAPPLAGRTRGAGETERAPALPQDPDDLAAQSRARVPARDPARHRSRLPGVGRRGVSGGPAGASPMKPLALAALLLALASAARAEKRPPPEQEGKLFKPRLYEALVAFGGARSYEGAIFHLTPDTGSPPH